MFVRSAPWSSEFPREATPLAEPRFGLLVSRLPLGRLGRLLEPAGCETLPVTPVDPGISDPGAAVGDKGVPVAAMISP